MKVSRIGQITALILFAFSPFTLAEQPLVLKPRVSVSQYGDIYFTMLPSGIGTAYRLEEDGSVIELWNTDGWYSPSVFISNDGRYLVRVEGLVGGRRPSARDLAVAFYDNGTELRRYSTIDLIKNTSSVRRTTGSYYWLWYTGLGFGMEQSEFPRLDYNNQFYLKTIEGKVLVFDISTGELINP